MQDIPIAIVDGLKGFSEAITAVFPDTILQTCIVHLIRSSIRRTSWKDRNPLAACRTFGVSPLFATTALFSSKL